MNQQRAIGILYQNATMNHLAKDEFARAFGKASNDLVKARAAEEDPALALR